MQTIKLKPFTADQNKYLQEIIEDQKLSDYATTHCTCPIGGPPGENNPPCPLHGTKRHGQVQFDAESPPESMHNRLAARSRHWHFDGKRYRDSDGSIVADRFGQRY